MTETLTLVLRPHVERAGFHTERFDAYLGDELICTSRQGWCDPARALLAMGYAPETLMHVQHDGKPHDPTIVPRSVGELAKWTYVENDRGGIRKVLYQPMPADLRWPRIPVRGASISGEDVPAVL